jgi:hypothetical protein
LSYDSIGLASALLVSKLQRKRRMLKILMTRAADVQGRWLQEVSMVAVIRIQKNALIIAILFSLATPLVAQDTTASDPQSTSETADTQLQKDVQNPVASLTLVPFQNNTNFDAGPFNRTQNVLDIQPVIPINISNYWKVIVRVVQPLVWQPSPNQNTGGEYGLGDMAPDFFFTPRHPGKLMWGIGPAFAIPTATNDALGQGKFSMGPSAVVLVQPGKWTIVNLVNNVWSVAGSGSRPSVNQMLDEYFITRNLQKGWYVTSSPIITANWKAPSGSVWTVPFGGGLGRVQKLGSQPVNWKVEFFGNAVHPTGAPSWTMRLTLAFLYPKYSTE